MRNLFVEFSIAEQLKKKGFNEPCIAEYYRGEFMMNKTTNEYTNSNPNHFDHDFNCSAPMFDQVVNWFREKHNIIIEARLDTYSLNAFKNLGEPCFKFKGFVFCMNTGEYPTESYETKEDALMKAITIALGLI